MRVGVAQTEAVAYTPANTSLLSEPVGHVLEASFREIYLILLNTWTFDKES